MTAVHLLIAAGVVLVVAIGLLSLSGQIRYWRFRHQQRRHP